MDADRDADIPVLTGFLHGAVAAQANRTPDALAITGYECPDLSYRDLLTRVERCVETLAARGIRRGDLVGLLLPRSPELVVAALAVTIAGGGFVPMDPSSPARRLRLLAEDACLRAIITDAAASCPVDAGVEVIDVSGEPSAGDREPRGRAPESVSPNDIAYMIYTSGSTGTPKGVPTTHSAIVELLCWMTATYPLDGSRRILLKTSPSFDVSIVEMFWPLVSGAALVVPHREGHRDPAHLAEMIQSFAVTDVIFVPSQLPVFAGEPSAHGCRSLRRLIAVGEELTPATLRQVMAILPEVHVINAYGPTEAAVLTLWHDCTPRDAHGDRVPIGRPIGRTRVQVVNPDTLAPVPTGTPGELILEGPQVARGYHRRPELTAARFLVSASGHPRYRTGDIVRVGGDGLIEFLGREDRQVKIRGYRVELGEVEAALRDVPDVRDARAAVLPDPIDRSPTLVAWVVVGDSAVTGAELRTFLSARLPDYLVPEHILPLIQFPMLPNGKLDSSALPDPFGTVEHRPPPPDPIPDQGSSPSADLIAETWRRLTGVDHVRVEDGFTESGGSSLLLLRLRSQLRALGYPHLRVLDLLTHPTPLTLAEFLSTQPHEQGVGS